MKRGSMICSVVLPLMILLGTTPWADSNNQTDFEALLAFKKAIDNGPMGLLSLWNETTHFCRWNGIWCSKRHQNRVVSISLPSQGLVGTLSPHIGNLSFLRYIDLQNNTFSGLIPEEMGRLRRLETINFSNNTFGGGIPRNLSQCRNLIHLILSGNHLTGSIVPEIGSLVKLDTLRLSDNMISGTIPPFLGNISTLTRLSLAFCSLQGEIPDSLIQLRRMQWLALGTNSLTGMVPLGLFNLSNLEVFDITSNGHHGTLPSDNTMFTLPKLRILQVGYNHFTGSLPASLFNSSRIEYLQISSNNFTGEMIDFSSFSALKSLMLPINHLKGDVDTVLSSLTNSTALESIGLGSNLFTGSLPDSIGNLSSLLRALDVGRNQISGRIPSSIGNLVGLTYLRVAFNNLRGPIPSSITKLQKLHILYFDSNRLTDEMPLSLGNFTSLNILSLRGNEVSGNMPPSLGNCTSLLRLDLSYNNLNGSIPPQILSLSSISISLSLSHNYFTGTIPSEVGALRNLGSLRLSYNGLSGVIPSSLSSCVMLESLHLEGNSLHGEIPTSMSSLRGLQDLDLSRNNFSGTIPRFLGELHLLNLNLSFNALHGEVPALGVFQNVSAISVEGNRGLCGGIAVLNLPSCPSIMNSKKKGFRRILIPTAGAICVAALSALFCIVIYRRRKSRQVQPETAMFRLPTEFLRLSYGDLVNATGGFSEANLVGKGRFGSVYRGSIINANDDEQTVVAVKVLNLNERGASRSLESECNALRGIRHRNLLKILSVCDSISFQGADFKALVYEFMANGSLESWLHQNSDEEIRILSTIQRLNIAIDIACGVEYLHSSTSSTIVHGDLKPGNILLDEDMVAHVGDFGLAKIVSSMSGNLSNITPDGSSSAAIKGTIGYIAPECGMNNVVSTHGDAYSYGILLLEMFTNMRPTSDAFVNIQDFIPDRVMEAVDPSLHQELHRNDEYQACVVSILRIGVRCSEQVLRDRMLMAEVVVELKRIRNAFLAADTVV